MIAGHLLAKEGRAMLPVLYPDKTTHAEAAKRLGRRWPKMIDNPDPAVWGVGFFLFGLVEAMEGRRNA